MTKYSKNNKAMADKTFLLEHNLLYAYNNFMHLCNENTLMTGLVDEEGEEGDPNAPQGGNPMAGGDPNAQPPQGGDPMAGDPMSGGEMPPMEGDSNAAMNGNGDPMAGGDPMSAGDPNAQGGGDPMADGDPMAGDPMGGGEMPPMEGEGMAPEEEEEVIDVEDITQAQEKTSSRVNKVGRNLDKVDDKIQDIMSMIQSITQMIDNNNAKISEFQKEFEKRNPTPVEQMNLRSLDSFPFNQNPKNYWEKKGTQPYVSGNRYEAYADNNEPVAKKEYVLTNKDIEDFNPNKIQDSFHISDDLRSTIEKIFDI